MSFIHDDDLTSFQRSLWGAVIVSTLIALVCVAGLVVAYMDGMIFFGIVSASGLLSSASLALLCVDDLRHIRP